MISLENDVLALPSSPEGKPTLLGSRCKNCGRVFFPRRLRCAACAGADLEQVNLSSKGRLFSFVVVEQKPKFALVEAPYVLGEVALPEGVHVYAVIRGCDPKDLQEDLEVTLALEKVRVDENGNEVMAYVFRPL